MKNPFLTCNWENLLYLNFEISPEILSPFLPKDVEPSLLYGKAMISIVCFEFFNARFFGLKIPFHQYFPEINVRTYVQKKNNPEIKGVYFLSEMVPKMMTVLVAKYLFGEPFSVHNISIKKTKNNVAYKANSEELELSFSVDFSLKEDQNLNEIEHFIIEKEYAFCGKKGEFSKLFKVKHQKWNILEVLNPKISLQCLKTVPLPIQQVLLRAKPMSIFATDGSCVGVFNLN